VKEIKAHIDCFSEYIPKVQVKIDDIPSMKDQVKEFVENKL